MLRSLPVREFAARRWRTSAGSCASRVSGDSNPRAPVPVMNARSVPTRSSLDHSPATNDSPAPISPRSSMRRNRPIVVDRRARGRKRTGAELDALARRQHELEARPAPARAQPVERGPSQHLSRRRHQPRQRDDQRMCELGHPRARYPGNGDTRAYEPRLRSADDPRAAARTARPRAAA